MKHPARELRSAVEAVLTVVRAEAEETPPRPVPAALRPYVGFTKSLPAPAVAAVCQAVDDDPDLRRRARDKATREQVGEIGWMWLDRPPGWEDQVSDLRDQIRADKVRNSKVRDEQVDGRKAQRAERAAGTAKARAEQAEAEVERLKRELTTARQDTRSAERERETAESDLARLQDERARAVRELKDVESDSAQRLASVRTLEQELADLQARYDELQASLAASTKALSSLEREALASAVTVVDPNVPDPPAVSENATPTIDVAAVAASLSAAAASVADLSHHLAGLGRIFAHQPAQLGPPTDLAPRPRRVHRRPQKLPVGMFDDGPEAVQHLIRIPHAVLLVDGYNVSISGWPDMVLNEQRRRLVDALDALAARSGVAPYVVFDGVDADGGPHARSTPAAVRVRFAPADIEADDIIISLVDDYPATIPVVVVSSDKRVQDGCRTKGANIITSPQLLEVLR